MPAFAELRNIVTGLTSYLAAARIIAIDLDRPLLVLEQLARGEQPPYRLLDDPRLVEDARNGREDLHDLVGSLSSTVSRMQRALMSLEHSLDAVGEERCPLAETLEIASTIADHATRSAGGVTWSEVPTSIHIDAPRFAVSLTVALLLRVLAEHARGRGGIAARVEEGPGQIELVLSIPGAPRDAYRQTVQRVGPSVQDSALLGLEDSEGGIRVRWARATDG